MTEGKEIGRSSGYKVTELSKLEDGGRLGVGGKKVEVTGEAGAVMWSKTVKLGEAAIAPVVTKSNKKREIVETQEVTTTVTNNITMATTDSSSVNKFKPFKIPARLNSSYDQFTPERRVQPGVSMFDPGLRMPWFCLALQVDMLCTWRGGWWM